MVSPTKPELAVRRYLHGLGFRYRLHLKSLPGSPDIVLPKYRVVILIHGCFWHRHRGCKYCATPSTNIAKWTEKFESNIARDERNLQRLREQNWRMVVIWECGLKQGDPSEALSWLPDVVRDLEIAYVEWPSLS
nr:DNA mismatch endonuclease Vsr [uncultured Herbaspirillum sp.]